MAFKLRSGNKTNFKSMGSSPMKQTTENISLESKYADAISERTSEQKKNKELQAQIDELQSGKDVGSKRSRRILEGKGTDEDIATQKLEQQERNEMASKVPWSKEVKDKHKYREVTGTDEKGNPIYGKTTKSDRWEDGKYIDTETDLTRAEKRVKNKQARENDRKDLEDYKNTKKEDGTLPTKQDIRKKSKQLKYDRKTARLHRKYEDAQAKGTQGLRFNWKNMFLGGVEDAFTVDSKKDILADKMKKRAEKTITKKKVKTAKEKLAKDKYERTKKVAIGTQIANIFRSDEKDKRYRGDKK